MPINTIELTETRLPWRSKTITVKGCNAGAEHLTAHFDGDTLTLIDFLNASLNAEYAAIYEEIMSRYEAKLKSGSLFDHGFPEASFVPEKLDISKYASPTPPDDKAMIDTLLKEYNTYLDRIKERFGEYEKKVEGWFNTLQKNP